MRLHCCALLIMLATRAVAGDFTPWERYVAEPTPDNARAVQGISYSHADMGERIREDLRMLELQVMARDEEAVRLGFRLLTSTSDHYGELLDTILGRLIRSDPELFLQVLDSNIDNVGRLDSLVCNLGDEYVDKFKAMKHEIAFRIAALRGVDIDRFGKLRNKCIRVLEEHLKLLKTASPDELDKRE